jgi:antitoxin HicB
VNRTRKSAREYLEQPFARVLIPDAETGTFTAYVQEFPGCVTQGKTPQDALKRLEGAAQTWLESALEQGRKIPSPFAEVEYRGKFALRMSRSLHRRAAEAAERERISLNQFIETAVAERLGAETLYDRLEQRFYGKALLGVSTLNYQTESTLGASLPVSRKASVTAPPEN